MQTFDLVELTKALLEHYKVEGEGINACVPISTSRMGKRKAVVTAPIAVSWPALFLSCYNRSATELIFSYL